MKKFFAILSIFASVFSARSDINVEWVDDNTIIVSGIGDGYVVTNVVTNAYGSCTNCVNISPAELRAYKLSIINECDLTDADLNGIIYSAVQINSRMNDLREDIGTFQRFTTAPLGGSIAVNNSDFISFTNYVWTVDNTQNELNRSHWPVSFSSLITTRSLSYNNGIYDYANDYILPIANSTYNDSAEVVYQAQDAQTRVANIRTIVNSMSEEPCECSGGSCSTNSASAGDCPCAEQMDAILDYVKHIDDDFHVQLDNMADVTNFIPRMDAYAKAVSSVLYNDGTIVVDDGENSWSNVYRRGSSDLYYYDKSNILQRIELLVFGLTSVSSSTNWGEVGEVESDVLDAREKINGVGDVISQNHQDISSDINTIKGKLQSLFNALNFFGAGSLSEFALTDPYTVKHFGNYTFDVTSTDAESLGTLRNIFRTCFQVFYWVSGICFMIFFWYWIISFTIKHVLGLLRFFNNLLT